MSLFFLFSLRNCFAKQLFYIEQFCSHLSVIYRVDVSCKIRFLRRCIFLNFLLLSFSESCLFNFPFFGITTISIIFSICSLFDGDQNPLSKLTLSTSYCFFIFFTIGTATSTSCCFFITLWVRINPY